MALVVKDRVRETSTTTGTGTLTLAGAVSGFQTFSSAIGNANTTYYTITNGSEWEVGLGTVAAGTLARTTIFTSSNAGSAVNFTAGTKDVFCSYPADKSIYTDGSYSNPAWITSISGSIVSGNITGNAANITGTYAGTITSGQVTTGLGYTPASNATTLSINGTSYDLSANRTWSVGTVTSVAALTLGTTGTDLSSTVATGTSTPVITLNVPTASASNRGALSAADWTTFNGKGSGSVTSASVVSANGFAGTVATATTTPAITLTTSITGMLKGSSSALVAATAGTDFVAPATATTFTATQTFSGSTSVFGASFTDANEAVTVSATAATGTIQYDISTQSVLYYTSNATANWTVNFRMSSGTSLNTALATGQSVTVVFAVTQGTTAYYNNAVTVDGTSVTPKYQGGSAWTSGNASGIDVYSYTIVKTGSAAYTILASQTQFK